MVENSEHRLPIETDRLIIRQFTPEDAPDILSISSDPNIAPYLLNLPGSSIDEVEEYIRYQEECRLGERGCIVDLAVELKGEKRVIGVVTIISHKERQGEVACALNVIYQRKGYATEAVLAALEFGFTVLDFHRIFSTTDRHNINSWMLMERVGMRREAIFLEDHQSNDTWGDSFVYALLKNEWEKKIKRNFE